MSSRNENFAALVDAICERQPARPALFLRNGATAMSYGELATLVSFARDNYNSNVDVRRAWGGGKIGHKSQMVVNKRQRAIAKEERRKAGKA